MATAPLRLGVLVSGSGTNLQAILDAIAAGALAARVVLVVSSRAGVPALERASRAGVPVRVVLHRDFADRRSYDAALVDALRSAAVEWVVLAGFMRLVTRVLLDAFPDRVLNIHPSLLPSFPGVDAQAQALAHGVRVTGCTVHLVDEQVDHGPIVAQAAVAVEEGDTVETLRARILRREHELLVSVLRWIAEGRVALRAPERAGERPRVVLRDARGGLGVVESP